MKYEQQSNERHVLKLPLISCNKVFWPKMYFLELGIASTFGFPCIHEKANSVAIQAIQGIRSYFKNRLCLF